MIGVPLLVFAFYSMTAGKYPNAIPLQASLDQILLLPAQVNAGVVDIETLKAEYSVPKRAMTLTVTINNKSEKPVHVVEFVTANVRFFNKALPIPDQGHSEPVLAPEGLNLDNAEPVKPGEQRTMTLIAEDSFWETEKLDGLIRDADSRIGGMLFLADDSGERYISSITAPVIPKFN